MLSELEHCRLQPENVLNTKESIHKVHAVGFGDKLAGNDGFAVAAAIAIAIVVVVIAVAVAAVAVVEIVAIQGEIQSKNNGVSPGHACAVRTLADCKT